MNARGQAGEALDLPDDVRRVVLSFDPRDTPDDMRRTAEHLGVAGHAGWMLGVAAPADIDRLARALGFWFEWDDDRRQFDHPALLVGIREGRVARLLVGGSVTAARLGEVVREARGQFIASYPLPGDVLFRCFDYDPVTGVATPAWVRSCCSCPRWAPPRPPSSSSGDRAVAASARHGPGPNLRAP